MRKYLMIILVVLGKCFSQNVSSNEIDALLANRNYSKVVEILADKLEKNENNYRLWICLGQAYQSLMNYEKAREAFYQAYEYDKFDLSLLISIGRNYVYSGAPEYAILFFEQAYEIDKNNITIMIDLANSYYEARKYESAKNIFQELTNADTTNAYYLKQLAQCYYKIGSSEEAISIYQKSFSINPRDANVAFQLAGLMVNKGETTKAMEILLEGLRHNGSNIMLNKLAAETLFRMKRYFDAGLQYKNIIASGDSNAANYQKLAFCEYYSESRGALNPETIDSVKFRGAITAFKKTIEIDSSDGLAYVYLAICYKERREFDKAIEYFEKGIGLSYPNYLSDAYSQLGYVFYQKQDFGKAIKAYKKSLEQSPEGNLANFQLASVYDKFYKDRSIPIMYYEKFLTKEKNADENLRQYATERIEYLKEREHFERRN